MEDCINANLSSQAPRSYVENRDLGVLREGLVHVVNQDHVDVGGRVDTHAGPNACAWKKAARTSAVALGNSFDGTTP